METLPCSDPPQPAELTACRQWLSDFLRSEVRPVLLGARPRCPQSAAAEPPWHAGDSAPYLHKAQLVGVGGTATILGCMENRLNTFDRARIEATRLTAARVSWHRDHLWSLPLDQRKAIVGLPKNRADVILMGVAVYSAVMEEFGFRKLRLSTRGLRFAALMQLPPESLNLPRSQTA